MAREDIRAAARHRGLQFGDEPGTIPAIGCNLAGTTPGRRPASCAGVILIGGSGTPTATNGRRIPIFGQVAAISSDAASSWAHDNAAFAKRRRANSNHCGLREDAGKADVARKQKGVDKDRSAGRDTRGRVRSMLTAAREQQGRRRHCSRPSTRARRWGSSQRRAARQEADDGHSRRSGLQEKIKQR